MGPLVPASSAGIVSRARLPIVLVAEVVDWLLSLHPVFRLV